MEEEPADTLPQGTLFADDYVIERRLARGGFGTVYLTTQRSTGKPRALKVLQSELAVSGKILERFATEARLASRIESEHVVEVVGSGVDRARGLPWLAMELLEGGDMMSLVERDGPLSPALAQRLFLQLGHALGAAHRVGIMHLDLKPENLFIAQSRRYGEGPLLKVLDFGIARVLAPDRTGATATSIIGSPRWWAPEQSSEGTHLRPSTDVWAVGLIAFFALTGRYYWKAAQPGAPGGIGMLLVEALTETLVPPSERAAALGCAGLIPPGFDAWFARCVVRDPAARFSEGGSACEALGRVLDGVAGVFTVDTVQRADPLGRTSPLGTGSASSSSSPHATPAGIASQTVTANGVGFSQPNLAPSAATGPQPAGATGPTVVAPVAGTSSSIPSDARPRAPERDEEPVPAGLAPRRSLGLRAGVAAALLAGALGAFFVVKSLRTGPATQGTPSASASALGAPTATELSPLGAAPAPAASELTALPLPSEGSSGPSAAPPSHAPGHATRSPLPRASAPSASGAPSASALPAPSATATPSATTAPVPTAQPSQPPAPTATASAPEPAESAEPAATAAPTATSQPDPTAAPSAPGEAPSAALPAFLDNPEGSPASDQVRAIVAACRTETQRSEPVTLVMRVNGSTGRVRRAQVSTASPELGTCVSNHVQRATINYGPFGSQSQQVMLTM